MNQRIIKNADLKFENTYITLPEDFFTRQLPDKVPEPKMVVWNYSLATKLGLNSNFFLGDEGVEVLAGNKVLEGSTSIAQAYAGHQFGYFTMLGDGRAILLGEYLTQVGNRYDIQLKGSGRTPYSRGGDGKATLGPMLREYIISEGMYGLGIPTTRSLAVLTTGEAIRRETILPGAVLVRVAKSHIRVGTFQYANQFGSKADLQALADYTVERHFKQSLTKESPYVHLLRQVVKKQAELIAKWQLVGFIHGVMNTDNMTISGETIDYGPCAFMDQYNPNTVFSSIDSNGRYSYENQPKMASWNLARLAEAMLPLLHENQEDAVKIAQSEIDEFSTIYHTLWYEGMGKKLGLFHLCKTDKLLIDTLLNLMYENKEDYTNTFLSLTLNQTLDSKIGSKEEFKQWLSLWQKRRKEQKESMEESQILMESMNPTIIPRNHRVEEALERAVDYQDYSMVETLVEALRHPYDYKNLNEYYKMPSKSLDCGYRTFCGT